MSISLAEYINEISKPFLIIAKSKGVTMKIDLSNKIILTVPQKAFQKAISNIISNAIAYTDGGME